MILSEITKATFFKLFGHNETFCPSVETIAMGDASMQSTTLE